MGDALRQRVYCEQGECIWTVMHEFELYRALAIYLRNTDCNAAAAVADLFEFSRQVGPFIAQATCFSTAQPEPV